MRHEPGEIGFALILVAPMSGNFLEIMTGTEGRALGRDHDDAHLIVMLGFIEGDGQGRHHRVTEAVAALGIVERQPQYALI